MDILQELERLLDRYKLEKSLKVNPMQDTSIGFWLFLLSAMMSGSFGTSTPTMPTSITNIYSEQPKDEVIE